MSCYSRKNTVSIATFLTDIKSTFSSYRPVTDFSPHLNLLYRIIYGKSRICCAAVITYNLYLKCLYSAFSEKMVSC